MASISPWCSSKAACALLAARLPEGVTAALEAETPLMSALVMEPSVISEDPMAFAAMVVTPVLLMDTSPLIVAAVGVVPLDTIICASVVEGRVGIEAILLSTSSMASFTLVAVRPEVELSYVTSVAV